MPAEPPEPEPPDALDRFDVLGWVMFRIRLADAAGDEELADALSHWERVRD
ncbi:MAG: hypothetical protein LC798_20890 [Chloroflexi bacterium]|nr:hypothetical protein [Chloroflexota bacterium]